MTPEHRWTHDPWGAEIVDGRMYGRGAADMKAGVVAMLGAVRALRDAGLRGDLCVETVIEEECTGNGAAACRARGPRTDAALIPEPFGHAALEAQVGVLWGRITLTGRAAHAERADQAVNAAMLAIPVLEAIRALEAEVNAESTLRLNYNVGVVRAGDWPSSVPEECVIEVRLAAEPGADLDAVKARFEHAVGERVEWRGFHAHGFEHLADGADLRRARARALGGARLAARVSWRSRARPTHGRSSCTTGSRPRATGRSAATCMRRMSGWTWTACATPPWSWHWRRRSGVAALNCSIKGVGADRRGGNELFRRLSVSF